MSETLCRVCGRVLDADLDNVEDSICQECEYRELQDEDFDDYEMEEEEH